MKSFHLFLSILCIIGMVWSLVCIVLYPYEIVYHLVFLALGLVGMFTLFSAERKGIV